MIFTNKIRLFEPDKTFYEQVKGVSLVENLIAELNPSDIAPPRSLNLPEELIVGWKKQHAPLIEKAFDDISSNHPFRSIFPGPYVPTLDSKMTIIGDTAYSVFGNIIKNIKQRIPELKKLRKNSSNYIYKSEYKPITRSITEPEEAWAYIHIKCPVVNGVNFPLPPTYEYEPKDFSNLRSSLAFINKKCHDFCLSHLGKNKTRTNDDILEIVSFINSIQYLFKKKLTSGLLKAFEEILKYYDKLNVQPKNPAKFLFEIEHALSYLIAIKNFNLVGYGKHDTFWVDIVKLPIENLIETELGDIQRVLREIRTFFALGWSPIVVHFDNKLAFNTDGTHRHYAILTIELLRRLKLAHHNKSIRGFDLNSAVSLKTIKEFQNRYKKNGLSFRETLRTVNYLVNNDTPWPYLEDLETELNKVLNIEFKYIPVIYLPEWRARSVVKNLCDKGVALVGVPPENIYIVGKSKGKKGIFIRGAYHGTDRQPMVWMNIIDLQKI